MTDWSFCGQTTFANHLQSSVARTVSMRNYIGVIILQICSERIRAGCACRWSTFNLFLRRLLFACF